MYVCMYVSWIRYKIGVCKVLPGPNACPGRLASPRSVVLVFSNGVSPNVEGLMPKRPTPCRPNGLTPKRQYIVTEDNWDMTVIGRVIPVSLE